jgi:uncharacterized protein YqeY
MSIKTEIRNNMYASMKANNKEDKQVYAMMLDNIQKAEKTALREFDDNEIIPLIQKQIKQCKETLEYAEKANNEVVINQTKNEIALLNKFLPQMMSEEEIKFFVNSVSETIEPIKNNKGLFMRECSKLRGKADMKLVAEIVDSILA